MTKKNKKYSIQSWISWGAAIIILALGAKILHFPWADPLIIFGFAVEFIVFIVMGFTYKEDSTRQLGSSQPIIDNELLEKLNNVLGAVAQSSEQVSKSSETNSRIVSALANEIGIKQLAEAIQKTSDISTLDLNHLEQKIIQTGDNFDNLNTVLEDLIKNYTKQVQAFKSV